MAEIGALGRRLGISRLQGLGEGGDAWVPPAPAPMATSQPEDSFGPGPRPAGEWEGDRAEAQGPLRTGAGRRPQHSKGTKRAVSSAKAEQEITLHHKRRWQRNLPDFSLA